QPVHATVDIGIGLLVERFHRLDDGARLLRRGAVVQVGQAPLAYRTRQDREISRPGRCQSAFRDGIGGEPGALLRGERGIDAASLRAAPPGSRARTARSTRRRSGSDSMRTPLAAAKA